jgi:hypothetical protein
MPRLPPKREFMSYAVGDLGSWRKIPTNVVMSGSCGIGTLDRGL